VTLETTLAAIGPADEPAMAAARDLQARLTKPAGSLGALEELSVRLAGLAGTCPPPLPEPAAIAVFAGDHGVHAQRVTPWPQEVTAQMVANFVAGGAVINAFARQVGASLMVVDVGVAIPLHGGDTLLDANIRRGTRDLAVEPAMTLEEARAALEVGISVAGALVDGGAKCLLTGDMGIANTTPAAALVAAFTGADAAAVTGRGTGIDDETLARKTAVVAAALTLHRPDPGQPLATLAALGGLEHAGRRGRDGGRAPLRGARRGRRAGPPRPDAAAGPGHAAGRGQRRSPGPADRHRRGPRPPRRGHLRLGRGLRKMKLYAVGVRRGVATFDPAGVSEK
jgi:nicotinate-nucleotide--dimethylbenzimidazole phosphoribosyltransferase